MKETSPDTSRTDRIRSWAKSKAHGGQHRSSRPSHPTTLLPLSNRRTASPALSSNNAAVPESAPSNSSCAGGGGTASPEAPRSRPVVEPGGNAEQPSKETVTKRFVSTGMMILRHSKVNWLLLFAPVGIAVKCIPTISPGVVFALNAIAIVPLAGLLSHATESVARRMGDTVGALLNVTFGNAVELIIFIIALTKGEIRIVQASLLGSILANLLLILGMSFLLGGLRYREQIYNSTVTQMSACLLSLSVISLVLPTAFHASFSNPEDADVQSLKISRGTSVILLLVYGIYLLFQLKSHAYLYESTPQHILDEEATPGPVASWLEAGSSDSSSSDSSDSESSGRSRETMSRRVKRAIRATRRHHKSSVVSIESAVHTRTSSFGTADVSPTELAADESSSRPGVLPRQNGHEGQEEAAVIDDEKPHRHHRHHRRFHKKHRKYRRHGHDGSSQEQIEQPTIMETPELHDKDTLAGGEPRCVDFARSTTVPQQEAVEDNPGRRPFASLRVMSLKPVAKSLAPIVFNKTPDSNVAAAPAGPVPRVRFGIRRTNSLPDRLNHARCSGPTTPAQVPVVPHTTGTLASAKKEVLPDDQLSRVSSILLLLVSTATVAVCAEFMVDSIDGLVATSSIKETFIGLIILPIVGNAAEHVTAVTVAMRNKIDLAIGVAIGSSIQIALFITPIVVILGWIMNQKMTLYFTLFETVCLFVSTFIVNFLVLDGRSNYLEGTLLCATYIIIGTVAFFYPNSSEASVWGVSET